MDVQRFHEAGYLLLGDVFDPQHNLDPVVREYTEKLDRVEADCLAAATRPSVPPARR